MLLKVLENAGENFSDADKKMSDQVMTLWTNFAKSGLVNANRSDSTSKSRSPNAEWKFYARKIFAFYHAVTYLQSHNLFLNWP